MRPFAAIPGEAEVVPPPPAVFKILVASMVAGHKLVIALEQDTGVDVCYVQPTDNKADKATAEKAAADKAAADKKAAEKAATDKATAEKAAADNAAPPQNGRGVQKFSNGAVYEGEFKDGKACGRGIHKWPSGQVYEGE